MITKEDLIYQIITYREETNDLIERSSNLFEPGSIEQQLLDSHLKERKAQYELLCKKAAQMLMAR